MVNVTELKRVLDSLEPKIVQLCAVPDGMGCMVEETARTVIALALYDDGTMRYVVMNGQGEERRPQVVSE